MENANMEPRKGLPPQVTRIGGLALCIVASYFVARHFLVPESFGEFGWYRGAALTELRVQPTVYGGHEACGDCHEEVAATKAASKHRSVPCESCHGALGAHVEDAGRVPEKLGDGRFCLRCHADDPARPAKFPMVLEAEHSEGQSCLECHKPHAPEA